MTEPALSTEARALLGSDLQTYERLEVLLAVRAGGSPMPVANIVKACRLDDETTRKALADLAKSQLVTYDPATKLAELAPAARQPPCEALMELYARDRPAILSILSTLSMRKIRDLAARAFADAFRFRKKGDGNG